MRTTVELPASLRQKLVNEAARRNVKGYSAIVVEALELYFQDAVSDRKDILVAALRGSMNSHEYKDAVTTMHEGRANWRM